MYYLFHMIVKNLAGMFAIALASGIGHQVFCFYNMLISDSIWLPGAHAEPNLSWQQGVLPNFKMH